MFALVEPNIRTRSRFPGNDSERGDGSLEHNGN
jgi:hypothetical protein